MGRGRQRGGLDEHEDAAAYVGITPRTLYRFIDHGGLPAYKLGRVIRVRRSDLDAFLESVRVKPGELKHLLPGTHKKASGAPADES